MLKTFRQAPFLRITFFFIAGILVQYHINISFFLRYALILPLFLLLFFCFSKKNKRYHYRGLFGWGILLFSFVCAAFLTDVAWKKSEWDVSGFHTYLVRVMDEPVDKPKTRMCKVEIISADSAINNKTINKQAIIYFPKDSLSGRIVSGDCLFIHASLKKPQALPGDASFDYPLYLRKQSFSAVAFVRQQDWQLKTASVPLLQSLHFQSFELRRSLFDRLRIILPDTQSFSVAAALMFGYKNELDKDLRQRFSNIGAGHILAVSGLHFNLLFGLAYFMLSFLGMSRKGRIAKQLILLPLIWVFAFITGLSPSVIRAAGMLTLWGIGNAFFCNSFTLNTLAVVALFMLLYNPLYLFDIGFQLSFLAVLSILVINPYLVDLYSSANKIILYLWELTAVSFSAQIGVLPLSLYYFHQFPLLFLLTNMLLIPLSGIIMALIPISFLIHIVLGNQEWLFFPLRFLMSCFISITESIDNVPGGSISNINLSYLYTIVLYAGIALVTYLLIRKKTV
jgi:competence protein ComEC